MYIRYVGLVGIKSITSLDMQFEPGLESGWHVILGENGSGKSSVIRAIALGLIGPEDFKALRLNLREWISSGASQSIITLQLLRDKNVDLAVGKGRGKKNSPLWVNVFIKAEEGAGAIGKESFSISTDTEDASSYVWGNKGGWFSAGFGPFRRFTGGDQDVTRIYYSVPNAGAHVSLFGENVAFMEALSWMRELHVGRQAGKLLDKQLLEHLTDFVNRSELLSHSTKIQEINTDGVFFADGNGVVVNVSRLSDGFRSMLSLVFELFRQLLRVYGMDDVFGNHNRDRFSVDVPGVVLIDEVDAHLHPTWQTRIGQWFTTYFPKIQFIVTTHSPLICRGAEKGTIWRLPSPGSEGKPEEVTGLDRKRLIYGDILDAYGTELFGEQVGVSQSDETKRLHKRMLELQAKSMDGLTTEEEEAELAEMRSYL